MSERDYDEIFDTLDYVISFLEENRNPDLQSDDWRVYGKVPEKDVDLEECYLRLCELRKTFRQMEEAEWINYGTEVC